jgi:hypothetical protein
MTTLTLKNMSSSGSGVAARCKFRMRRNEGAVMGGEAVADDWRG